MMTLDKSTSAQDENGANRLPTAYDGMTAAELLNIVRETWIEYDLNSAIEDAPENYIAAHIINEAVYATPAPDAKDALTALDIAKAALHALANPHYEWDEPRAEAMRQFANERIGKMLDAPDDDMRIAATEAENRALKVALAASQKFLATLPDGIGDIVDEHLVEAPEFWEMYNITRDKATWALTASAGAVTDKEDSRS